MSQASTGIDTALRRESALGAAQVIRSPEQVALDLEIAGPMSRMLAFSVDYGILLIVQMIVLTALVFAAMSMANLEQLEQVGSWLEDFQANLGRGEIDFGPWILLMLAVWIAIDFVLQWGYFVACELLMQGRSPGKAMIGLRVVRDGGLPVGVAKVIDENPVATLVLAVLDGQQLRMTLRQPAGDVLGEGAHRVEILRTVQRYHEMQAARAGGLHEDR